MAIHGAFTNAAIWFGTVDLSCNANNVSLGATVADLDATTFCSGGAKERVGGLVDSTTQVSGFATFGAGLEDDVLWSSFAANTHAMTISPTGADGSLAYLLSALQTDYKLGGTVGEILPFSQTTSQRDTNGIVRGIVAMPKTVLTGAGATNGTAVALGAVTAAQSVYAALHVFSETAGTNPTLSVIVKSAVTNFATITNRVSMTQVAGAGIVSDEIKSTAGAITDTFWRPTFTVAADAGTPVYTVALFVGIQ